MNTNDHQVKRTCNTSCDSCFKDNLNNSFNLQCGHNLCCFCFSKAVTKTCGSPYIKCQCCDDSSCTWFVTEHYTHPARKKVRLSDDVLNDCNVDTKEICQEKFDMDLPDITKDPKQYHKLLDKEKRQKTVVLSLTASNLENQQDMIGTYAVALNTELQPEQWDDKDVDTLIKIFRSLSSILIREDDLGDDDLEAYIDDSIELNMTDKNCSVLHRVLHAFATQQLIYEEKDDDLSHRLHRMKSFVATDVIRSLKFKNKVGKLQHLFAKQLVANCANQNLCTVSNRLGFTFSLAKNRRLTVDEVISKIVVGAGMDTIDPHDMFFLLYDNIGFKVLKGYDQYTALQWVRIPKSVIRDYWKLYPQPEETMDSCPFPADHKYAGKSYKDLRVCINWEDVSQNVEFEEILGITDDDASNLADSIFSLMNTVLSVFEELPSYEEAKILLENEDHSWNKHYTGNATSCTIVPEVALPHIEEDQEGNYTSNYEANNSILDLPLHSDLNSSSTCVSLMNYAKELRTRSLESATKEEWKNIPKIYESTSLDLLGDGNPTSIMRNQIKTNNATYGGNINAHFGGFHLGLEMHRKRGDLFGKSHLEDIFSCWRPTEGQLKWVLHPGDPNQIDAELSMYVLGIYTAAVHSYIEMKGQENDSEKFEVTAMEIMDHMISRARDWPIVMTVFIEIRFAHLIFILNESEENCHIGMYNTVQKYLARLFAATHCTKYVSMLVDFFVEWYCKSPAEKIIYTNGIFTRKTKNGKNIFTVSSKVV